MRAWINNDCLFLRAETLSDRVVITYIVSEYITVGAQYDDFGRALCVCLSLPHQSLTEGVVDGPCEASIYYGAPFFTATFEHDTDSN